MQVRIYLYQGYKVVPWEIHQPSVRFGGRYKLLETLLNGRVWVSLLAHNETCRKSDIDSETHSDPISDGSLRERYKKGWENQSRGWNQNQGEKSVKIEGNLRGKKVLLRPKKGELSHLVAFSASQIPKQVIIETPFSHHLLPQEFLRDIPLWANLNPEYKLIRGLTPTSLGLLGKHHHSRHLEFQFENKNKLISIRKGYDLLNLSLLAIFGKNQDF